MKFFEEVGRLALGSRVRLLAEKISQDAAKIYQEYETNLQPKWFPVFYALSKREKQSVTSIAEHIGHSHVSVSKILAEMSKAGIVTDKPDPKDGRRTQVALSKLGREIAQKIESQYSDVNAAIQEMSSQATHDLWAAIEEWDNLLNQKSLLDRVVDRKKRRESSGVKIVPYHPKYLKAFQQLNEEWISTYFKMEKSDREALENPQKSILDRGGHIFVATINGKPVGVCALLKRDDQYQYELAKMAVSTEAQGQNIGFKLGQAVIEKTRALGGERIFLESNTVLKPAMRLYEKLGFKKIVGPPSPYERCDIQMEAKRAP